MDKKDEGKKVREFIDAMKQKSKPSPDELILLGEKVPGKRIHGLWINPETKRLDIYLCDVFADGSLAFGFTESSISYEEAVFLPYCSMMAIVNASVREVLSANRIQESMEKLAEVVNEIQAND